MLLLKVGSFAEKKLSAALTACLLDPDRFA
jgi:hypothetical protein